MQTNILADWNAARANKPAASFGSALGLFPPLCAYTIMHFVLNVKRWEDLLNPYAFVVLGAMMFSITTVYQWGRSAFDSRWKAVWLVITYEGAMVVVVDPMWLAALALVYLVSINAIATACIIARQSSEPVPEVVPEPKTVTEVTRELNVPRRVAAKLMDRQRAPT